jgi:hypothetical protein
MDWISKAIELKKDYKWEELPEKIYELTGEMYNAEKIRAACRRRLANFDSISDISKEGFEESLPIITEDNGIFTIVTRSSSREPVYISKNMLRELKRLYCTKPYPTMNDCSRQLNIPREDFYLILKAFKITHDDVPYIDEDLVEREIEDLALESLEHRKHQYKLTFDRLEIDNLRKENAAYRKQDYLLEKYHHLMLRDFNIGDTENPIEKITFNKDGSYMLEIPVVDLHLGKLSWKPETGENYDYKIAEKRFNYLTAQIIDEVKEKQFEKILYPIGQDFFHFDTISTTTTAGTHLDSDMRWQKLFVKGVEMLRNAIDALSEIAPVYVFGIPGNHDKMTTFYALIHLSAWYRNEPMVIVNTDPKSRNYFEFGNTLIGYTHGDKEGKRIFGNMQVEAPVAWGRTKYREWHTGHLHSEGVKEEHGVIVRRLPSITGTDAWHFEQGYVGAIARHQSFIWHKERGLTNIIYTVIE